ncbi:MAG: hypothetical protein MMC33_008558 [Icmadophila ericetorum]|nr:hypothetical protein [Icmadophila ericetorum]
MANALVAPRQSFGQNTHAAKEIYEYERILNLRDEVFAGTHPRLKLPSVALKPSVTSPGSVRVDAGTQPNGFPPSSSSQTTLSHEHSQQKLQPSLHPMPKSNVQKTSSLPKTPNNATTLGNGSSGLDPIFLTKSEDLQRAEMRLARQRIEKALEEQFQQKKYQTRQKLIELEANPDFDVSDVLDRAQEIVKPLAANESVGANVTASSSDSFDDNTFYSSQVNESPTEDNDEHPNKHKSKPCRFFFEGACRKGEACTYSHDPAFREKMQKDVFEGNNRENGRRESPRYSERSQENMEVHNRGPQSGRHSGGEAFGRGQMGEAIEAQASASSRYHLRSHVRVAHDSDDEMEYSPPEPHVPSHGRNFSNNQNTQPSPVCPGPNSSTRRAHSRNGVHPDTQILPSFQSANDVRVVRNHITSPAAPQPARVSPLAVARHPKVRQLQQNDRQGSTPRIIEQSNNANPSPNIPLPTLKVRKRRRALEAREAERNTRRAIESPQPYIKEEPLSPPRFAETSAPRRQLSDREPMTIDTSSPHHSDRVVYHTKQPVRSQPVEIYDPPSPRSPVVRRVISRSGQRYEIREEPDVRRVYSAQTPLRPQSPLQELSRYAVQSGQPSRSISHSYIVHPEREPVRQIRASVQPQPAPIYQRERSLSPRIRTIQYSPQPREMIPMAPPPRRIVVDQDGKQYFEAPLPVERRASVAPVQRYADNYAIPLEETTPRRSAARVQLADPYDGRSYVQRVISPAPTSPRYVEYYPATEDGRAESRRRVYEPAEEVYPGRNSVVRMAELPQERVQDRYEQVVGSRPGVQRIHSVQPSGVQYERIQSVQPPSMQYEVVREAPPRVQSVRPEVRMISLGERREIEAPYARHVGVRPEERYVRAPSYATYERPRYQVVSNLQDGRYENGVPEEILREEPRIVERRRI